MSVERDKEEVTAVIAGKWKKEKVRERERERESGGRGWWWPESEVFRRLHCFQMGGESEAFDFVNHRGKQKERLIQIVTLEFL